MGRLGMKKATPCHSESPVFGGRRIQVVSFPIRLIEIASTKPAQEQNSALDNGFTLGFEPLLTNPSPGPLRLVKAPAAGHPLPKGEGGFPNLNAHQK